MDTREIQALCMISWPTARLSIVWCVTMVCQSKENCLVENRSNMMLMLFKVRLTVSLGWNVQFSLSTICYRETYFAVTYTYKRWVSDSINEWPHWGTIVIHNKQFWISTKEFYLDLLKTHSNKNVQLWMHWRVHFVDVSNGIILYSSIWHGWIYTFLHYNNVIWESWRRGWQWRRKEQIKTKHQPPLLLTNVRIRTTPNLTHW